MISIPVFAVVVLVLVAYLLYGRASFRTSNPSLERFVTIALVILVVLMLLSVLGVFTGLARPAV